MILNCCLGNTQRRRHVWFSNLKYATEADSVCTGFVSEIGTEQASGEIDA